MDIALIVLTSITVPILFQVVILARKQAQRHAEVTERLIRLEEKLGR